MMYHEPIDMMTRMISVPLETKSPCFQRASRPYGFSIVSFSFATGGRRHRGGLGAASAGAAASAGLARVGGRRLGLGRGGEHQRRCRRAGEDDGREQRGQSADQVHVYSSKFPGDVLRVNGADGASVRELEVDVHFADEADRLGGEAPLRERADDLAVEDARRRRP